MKTELRIANIADREKVVSTLVENGYTVKVVKRERTREYHHFDYFVVILDSPKMPDYYPESED